MTEFVLIGGLSLGITALAVLGAVSYIRRSEPGWTPPLSLLIGIVVTVIVLSFVAVLLGPAGGMVLLLIPIIGLALLLVGADRPGLAERAQGAPPQWLLLLLLLASAVGFVLTAYLNLQRP